MDRNKNQKRKIPYETAAIGVTRIKLEGNILTASLAIAPTPQVEDWEDGGTIDAYGDITITI
jgi:hypothetical protein